MNFNPLPMHQAYTVDIEAISDERGFFARTFCQTEFTALGLIPPVAQCSLSFNPQAGTLRGLHYQQAPHEEAKLVRCTQGSLYDVIIDLRPNSPTFKHWVGIELSARNRRAVYVPPGVAHGFLTLSRECEVLYQISHPFHPQAASGVRWDDPAFAIEWPAAVYVISRRDREYPNFAG